MASREIEFVGRVVAYGPQEGRRDQRGKRPNVLALDCVEERPIHFVEGGVRLVRIFEDDLHLGIRDLLQLGDAGRRWKQDRRGKKTAQQIACRHVHGYRLFVRKSVADHSGPDCSAHAPP
jgi:hypothetical protein